MQSGGVGGALVFTGPLSNKRYIDKALYQALHLPRGIRLHLLSSFRVEHNSITKKLGVYNCLFYWVKFKHHSNSRVLSFNQVCKRQEA